MADVKLGGLPGIPEAEPVPKPDQGRTIAHLASTVLTALGHASRHTVAAQHAGSPDSQDFNLRHVLNHLGEAVEHQRKLIHVLAAYSPGVGEEVDKLRLIAEPGSMAPIPRSSEPASDYEAVIRRGPQPEPAG